MLKWNGLALDGTDEAILRVREQDEEFCRILRAAIETRSRILSNRTEHRTRHEEADGNGTQAS